MKYQRSY